jgi:hypothetical protein
MAIDAAYAHLPLLERGILGWFQKNEAPMEGWHVKKIMLAVKHLVTQEANRTNNGEGDVFA